MQEPGVYYFLGNITSHILHALPLYEELGGTFVVLSKKARDELKEKYGVKVIAVNDKPRQWTRFSPLVAKPYANYVRIGKDLKATSDYLNKHAKVVIFYEPFDFAPELRLTRPKTVFLTHGFMLKDYMTKSNRLEIIKQYDYMAAIGPYLKQKFISEYSINPKKLVDIGIARTDVIGAKRQKMIVSKSLVAQTGIAPKKRIIVYAPTFWGPSSVDNSGLNFVRNFPEDYTLFFRPHPQTPKKILEKYRRLIKDRPNIVYAPEGRYTSATLENLLLACSVIVGDLSSVMIEAILIEKPLVFMSCNGVTDYSAIQEIYDYSQKVDLNTVDIKSVIDLAIKTGVDRSVWSANQRNNFFNFAGDSTKAIAGFIRNLI